MVSLTSLSPVTPPASNLAASNARAADGDYKTSGPGHTVKDSDGDYKPSAKAPAKPAATTLAAALSLPKGG